jgi:5-methylcytosine-specific restriction endonuclease McrA
MHVDHIHPKGGNSLDNLALACASCNLSKGVAVSAQDPETDATVALFNPRHQLWYEHFEWHDSGAIINGKTAIGRATVVRLKMNIERVVTARKIWIKADEHPPN